MKALAFVLCVCALLLSTFALASQPSLWAFNVGPGWDGQGLGLIICPDPFSTSPGAYPPGWNYLMDASYDVSRCLLYVSGGITTPSPWTQHTIGIYAGGPGDLDYVSSSDTGMGGMNGYSWLGGIALLNESLYAVCYQDSRRTTVVLLRIDDPGTAGQTVTQIGPLQGDMWSPGTPFNLCSDGQGSLFSVFRSWSSNESTLYRIDPGSASVTALHTYPDSLIDGWVEGLTLSGDSLYGVTTYGGQLIRFDLDTYEGTVMGVLWQSTLWTGLVTIPEPSAVGAVGLALVVGVLWRRARRR